MREPERVPERVSEVMKYVSELRKSLGLTQERFAAKLGTTVATVNRWENGKNLPSRLAMNALKALEKGE